MVFEKGALCCFSLLEFVIYHDFYARLLYGRRARFSKVCTFSFFTFLFLLPVCVWFDRFYQGRECMHRRRHIRRMYKSPAYKSSAYFLDRTRALQSPFEKVQYVVVLSGLYIRLSNNKDVVNMCMCCKPRNTAKRDKTPKICKSTFFTTKAIATASDRRFSVHLPGD